MLRSLAEKLWACQHCMLAYTILQEGGDSTLLLYSQQHVVILLSRGKEGTPRSRVLTITWASESTRQHFGDAVLTAP